MSNSGHGLRTFRAARAGLGPVVQVLGLIAFCVVSAASPVAAQGPASPCRAVLVQPASEELGLRVLGQSRDVSCTLELVPADEGASCAALATEHGALAVLRVREPSEGSPYEVVVCDAVASSEQVRSVSIEHGAGDALGASAAYEAVALVVRSALVDIVAVHEAREAERVQLETDAAHERAAAAREAEAKAAAARQRAEAEEDADARADEAAAGDASPSMVLLVGGEALLLSRRTIAPAIHARALAVLGWFRVGGGVSLGLPGELRDELVEIAIARHSVVAIASAGFMPKAGVTLEAGVHAGIAALTRSTRTRAGVAPTSADIQWSPILGAELGASLQLLGPLGFRPHLALDLVPAAPRYAYETAAGSPAPRTQLAPAYPVHLRLGASLSTQF